MTIFKKELYGKDGLSAGDVAKFWACPQYYAYIDQTPGKSFFPFRADMRFLINLRYRLFSTAYSSVLEYIKNEEGLVSPDKIPKIVEEAYSSAIKKLKLGPIGFGERFKRRFYKFPSYTFKGVDGFLNKLLEYKDFVLSGKEKLIRGLSYWAEKNYNSDAPENIIIGVDNWGEIKGQDDITARPSLLLALKEPNEIRMIKLRGGGLTDQYMKNWMPIDEAKLAVDYLLFREDPDTFQDALKLFGIEVENNWDLTELGVSLSEDLKIICPDISIVHFKAGNFKEGIEDAFEGLKIYQESKKSGNRIPWQELKHKEETCPGGHPILNKKRKPKNPKKPK